MSYSGTHPANIAGILREFGHEELADDVERLGRAAGVRFLGDNPRTPRTDNVARFTEAHLRMAHRAGWTHGRRFSNYTGPYKASLWDFSKVREQLGLGPRAKKS